MFEWDSAKSAANKAKHGIDFEEAQAIWADSGAVILELIRPDEPRWMAVGRAKGKFWAAIYTLRSDSIRLISVRRARKSEVKAYAKEN